MENTVPSGRGEFKPVETPPAAVEAGSPEEDEYESLRAEMKEAFGKYQNEGFVRIQYITKLFLGTV